MAEALVSRERLWYGDLPAVCVKTGAAADGKVHTSFERMPPWTFLLLLAGIFPFFIALLFVRQRVRGEVPVTAEVVERYHAHRRQLWVSWGLVAFGFLAAIALGSPWWISLSGIGAVYLAMTEARRSRDWIDAVPVSGSPFVELRRVHPAFAEAVANEHRRSTS